jgi:hypothetical protein
LEDIFDRFFSNICFIQILIYKTFFNLFYRFARRSLPTILVVLCSWSFFYLFLNFQNLMTQESLTIAVGCKSIERKLQGLSLTEDECKSLLREFKQMFTSSQVILSLQ